MKLFPFAQWIIQNSGSLPGICNSDGIHLIAEVRSPYIGRCSQVTLELNAISFPI